MPGYVISWNINYEQHNRSRALGRGWLSAHRLRYRVRDVDKDLETILISLAVNGGELAENRRELSAFEAQEGRKGQG